MSSKGIFGQIKFLDIHKETRRRSSHTTKHEGELTKGNYEPMKNEVYSNVSKFLPRGI